MPTGVYIRTKETRARMSLAKTNRIVSPETCAKISTLMRGRKNRLGTHQSEEAKAKMSAAHTGPLSYFWKGGSLVSSRKKNAKRRALGFIPLNGWFLGCEGHHVDSEQVIYMPHKLHRSVYHNQYTGRGMAQINAVAYNFLFKQEVERTYDKFI